MRRISGTSKGDPTLENLKADNAREIRNVRRWIDTNTEMKRRRHDRRMVATQMTPKEQEEVHRGDVSVAIQTEVVQSAKEYRCWRKEERLIGKSRGKRSYHMLRHVVAIEKNAESEGE